MVFGVLLVSNITQLKLVVSKFIFIFENSTIDLHVLYAVLCMHVKFYINRMSFTLFFFFFEDGCHSPFNP